jgi:hypothetical protein
VKSPKLYYKQFQKGLSRKFTGGSLPAPIFLKRVGDGLLERHRPTLPPRLLPRLLTQARAHRGNAGVGLGKPVGVSGNALCFL